MTNLEIMSKYKQANGIAPEVEMYTYQVWKSLGYQVRRGERSKHKLTLYKHTTKKIEKDGEEKDVANMFLKTCSLFTRDQVDQIEE